MKKRLLTALLPALLLIGLAGCGSSGRNTSASYSSDISTDTAMFYTQEGAEELYGETEAEASAENTASTVYENAGVKLIRTASLSFEATDLDAACAQLEALVTSVEGYVESSQVYGSAGDSYRSASYTARVPSGRYEEFLSQAAAGEATKLTYKSESTEDVGQTYADIEQHIEMLNTKLTRLNELLAQAESLTDIITLEDAISQAEYDLASYTTSKNSYDALIDYATITITIDQVTVYSPEESSFASQLQSAFLSGCAGFVDGLQGFALWVVEHALTLLLLAVIIVAAVTLVKRRGRRGPGSPEKKHRKRKNEEPQQNQGRGEIKPE